MGAGLHREALLLQDLLALNGHESRLMHYTDGANAPMERADINLFLEVVMPTTLPLAKENWLAPNCEWWPDFNDQYLPHFTKILCKTRDCYDIWSKKVGADKCVYTSFEARDIFQPHVRRENTFLHIAGKSANKGTAAVLAAWQMIPNGLPPLTVVASNPEFKAQFEQNRSNITFYHDKIDEPLLQDLMNRNKFHIQPSPYEGFGHVQHEGMGCANMVIVVNAPPFQGYTGSLPIVQPSHFTQQRLARMAQVAPNSVRLSCLGALDMFHDTEFNVGARVFFLKNRDFFRKTFMALVEGV